MITIESFTSKNTFTFKNTFTLGDLTWGGEHTIQYSDNVLQDFVPETYTILLTNVIPMNSIKTYYLKINQ